MKANSLVRDELKKHGVRQWELADKLGISPAWLNIKLRKEFAPDELLKALRLIDEIAKEKRREA